jgi:hypothetical protein
MINKYKGLVFASVLLRILAVVTVLGGVGFCLWFYFGSEHSELSRIGAILGIGGSLVFGTILYSLGELISFVFDVWAGVVDKGQNKVG